MKYKFTQVSSKIMAIHTLFSYGRHPENEKRGCIFQLQQNAVWTASELLLRVPPDSFLLLGSEVPEGWRGAGCPRLDLPAS